jgi:hypothetical protein
MAITLNNTILAFAGSGSHELTFTYDKAADTSRSQVSVTFSATGMKNITNSYRAYYNKNGTGGLRFAFPKIDDSGSNLNKPVTIRVDDSSITVYQIANPTLTLYGGLSKEETYSANTAINAGKRLEPIGGEAVVNTIILGDNDYYIRGSLTFDQSREMDAIEWAHLKLFSGIEGTIDSGRIYNDYLWDPKGRNFICCFDDPSLFKGNDEIMRLEVVYYTRKKYLGHETYLLKRGW